jgi:hypothetical protein
MVLSGELWALLPVIGHLIFSPKELTKKASDCDIHNQNLQMGMALISWLLEINLSEYEIVCA